MSPYRVQISYGVSTNRANPDRIAAWCECGIQFMSAAATRRTTNDPRRVNDATEAAHRRHLTQYPHPVTA